MLTSWSPVLATTASSPAVTWRRPAIAYQVLDARHIPGGGAATEEILDPGFFIDSCSTGHTLIRANPLLVDDELGLVKEYGLSYLEPDPVAHVAFPDGEQITMWLDFERTIEEIARFSAEDAAAYRRMSHEYDKVKSLFTAAQFTPIGFGPSLDQRLAEHPDGKIWARRRALSAWDVIRHEFKERHVQSFMLWMAFQTFVLYDQPGTGMLAYMIFARQVRSWSIPVGGSGQLTHALVSYLEAHGGSVTCDKRVSGLIIEDGRCVGVETADGDSYRATTAVLSTIHVKHLIEMAPKDCLAGGVPLRRRHLQRRNPRLRRLLRRRRDLRSSRLRGAGSARSVPDSRGGPRTSSSSVPTSDSSASSTAHRGCWWRHRAWLIRSARRPACIR